MTRLAHFKYFNVVAFLLLAGGLAGLSTLRTDPPTGQIVGYQILFSIGGGMIFPGLVVAVQAALVQLSREGDDGLRVLEADQRISTSLISCTESLGQALGVAIGSATLQNAWDALVADNLAAGRLVGGNSTTPIILTREQAARAAEIILDFPPTIAHVYRDIAAQSIARVWLVCLGFAVVGILAALGSRNLSLDDSVHSEDEKRA